MSRSRRWLFTVLSILSLGLYLWGFRGQLHKSALPDDFPRQQLQYPVLFEGIVASGPEEVRFLAEGWRQGEEVHLVEADGTEHDVILVRPDSTTYLAITLASALLFWAVAAFVFAPRAGMAGVATFYGICWLYGLGIMIGGVFFTRHPLGTRAMLDLVQLACLAFVPPLFVRMAMTFPRRSALLERLRWLLPGLWLVATALLVWQGWSFLRYFRATPIRSQLVNLISTASSCFS